MNKLLEAVEKHKKLILEAEKHIWNNPESGYREFKTSIYMASKFNNLGYKNIVKAENIPGFYTVVDTGKPGPTLLILAELDSLVCPNHPDAHPETGCVHACGHHAQCAAILGVAGALRQKDVLDELCGRIKLCLVPAEELIEIEYRTELKEKGIIKYFGGKGEFLYRGYFDDVDLAFMVHTSDQFMVRQGSVGCIAKSITYKGQAAHGASAWEGKNALYAATQGLAAANALRETFKEEDMIRFHPIITHGGEVVNAIPDKVNIESYVRGATFDALVAQNEKINQALCGAALSINGNIEITDYPGYAPLYNNRDLINLVADAAKIAVPEKEFVIQEFMNCGSTDMGELCGIMPVVHPYIPGAKGICHGDNYCIEDPYTACVGSAKWQIVMLKLLLENNAERAYKIINNFKPRFKSKEEYLDYVDKINSSGDRIRYTEDGYAQVKIK